MDLGQYRYSMSQLQVENWGCRGFRGASVHGRSCWTQKLEKFSAHAVASYDFCHGLCCPGISYLAMAAPQASSMLTDNQGHFLRQIQTRNQQSPYNFRTQAKR